MNKKLKIISFCFAISLVVNALFVFDKLNNMESNVIISSENLSGYEDSFGSTVAIYVEQTQGQGDYIQKNNVPDDGSVYTVNSATHCIGGEYRI